MWDKSASSVGKSLHTGSKCMDFSIFSTKVCEKYTVQSGNIARPLTLRISHMNELYAPLRDFLHYFILKKV